MKYKRIFVIVMDSLGIGEGLDADKFDDFGTNTFKHIADNMPEGKLDIPHLNSLGVAELDEIKGTTIVSHPHSFSIRLNEASNGKDTMTGHWEMMGILTTKPFQTFTDTGFPPSLMEALEKETGHKLIGNKAASGTEILKELGEECMRDNSLIIYTSSDSVLQLCGHEETMGLEELYRCCKIARELTMKPEWFVGRVIARPFIGTNKDNFKRTSNRHDYSISPSGVTTMDILKENNYEVRCIGKINDIFNGVGVTWTVSTKSNEDGMDKTIAEVKNEDFKEGLCFVNLVEFDSEYGHRRNPVGYGRAIEAFDKRLGELLPLLKEDDLLMITADHGNDPTYKGSDHTREKVPLLIYSKSIKNGQKLPDRNSFSDIGATILENFKLEKKEGMIGEVIKEVIEK